MSQLSRTALKAFFETGDLPTEAQFIDLIDSLVDIVDDGILVGGENGIIANPAGTFAATTLITKRNNNVTVAIIGNDSVKLPIAIPGMVCMIRNSTGLVIRVFPNVGASINNNPVGAFITLNPNIIGRFHCTDISNWYF